MAEQLAEKLEKQRSDFYRKVDQSRKIDESFAREEDLPLTQEEIDAIDAYWGRYSFAYPNIDYKSFQTFKNRCGFFDVRHVPGAIRTQYLTKHFWNKNFSVVFQHKSMLPFLYSEIKQPRPVVIRMDGVFYDGDYNCISRAEAIDKLYDFVCEGEGNRVIVKPNNSSGGHNICVIDASMSKQQISKAIQNLGISAFIAQEMIRQSAFTAQFNASSVNTIRMISLFFQNEVHPLAALIRIGKSGSSVDNWCSGGALLGVDIETGKCLDWALANDKTKMTFIPPDIDLKAQELVVPSFEKIKESVKKLHRKIPYMKLISWDIALDEGDEPLLIECNFMGMTQIHEATTGPLFGDLTDAVLDEYLLKRFCLDFADENFLYAEYSDHIVVKKYLGSGKNPIIPESLRGKPVTLVLKDAFDGTQIENISLPVKLIQSSKALLSKLSIN